jgi:membrane protein YdbS with pleckstrin-like domain
MAFPTKLLIPGEEMVVELRPHPVALALAALITLAELVVGIWLFTVANGWLNWLIVAAMVVVFVWYPLRKLVAWLTSYFVVTTDRVIQREGWVAKRSIEIPLEQINDIRFTQGVFERMIGAGTLTIRSASEDGPTEFRDIRHPEAVQRTVYHQAELNNQRMYQGRGGPGAGVTPTRPDPMASTPSGAPSTTTELERLADLRARGVLTEEEFQAQKSKILGQG